MSIASAAEAMPHWSASSVNAPDRRAAETVFRPSVYTAALLCVLRSRKSWVEGAHVLDVGCGSGVLLAAAAALGAAALAGVDVEAGAVDASAELLTTLAGGREVELHRGHLFDPVRNRRFDLILANLPHYPMEPADIDDRLRSWNSGGSDGRALLDRFVEELGDHLRADGRALMAHNAFVGLEATHAAVARQGLSMHVVDTLLVPLPAAKLERMTIAVLRRESGRSIHRYGSHAFGEVHLVVIGRNDRT